MIGIFFKKTHCVTYLNKIHPICFMIWTVNSTDSMCYIFYCAERWYIGSPKNDLNRHNLFDILLRFIQFVLKFDQWINQTLCVRYITVLIGGIFGNSIVI